MNEGGRLQRVVTPFAPQAGGRPDPEIPMHEREQVVPRLDVPAPPGLQQECTRAGGVTCHVGHLGRTMPSGGRPSQIRGVGSTDRLTQFPRALRVISRR